jgi:outer membrane protein assembly factor BamA
VIDPGRRVYVRRIDVAGNSKTRDEVVRREMRQLEGRVLRRLEDPALAPAHRAHRVLQRDHGRDPAGRGQSPTRSTWLYTVKERPDRRAASRRGLLQRGEFAVSTSIRQSNAFGTGKFILANINSGKVNTVYALSYNDPYYTVDGVSQGFDVYKRKTDASSPRGRRLHHRCDRRRNQVRLPGLGDQLGRRRGQPRVGDGSPPSSTARCATSTSSTSSAAITSTAPSPPAGSATRATA